MAIEPFPNMISSATVGGTTLKMESLRVIKSARLSMLEARQALEDYERLKGAASASEHVMLNREFTKATQTYLRLSAHQR